MNGMISIQDIAYVHFSVPNLDRMAEFLHDFGLVPAKRTNNAHYARGAGSAPFSHVTSLGPPGFVALGLRAASLEDIQRLADAEGVDVDASQAPGGGKLVRLIDPDGLRVEVVADQAAAVPLPLVGEPSRNSVHSRSRIRSTVRIPQGPSTVVRLGHAVFTVADFRRSEEWYKSRFGFISSDEIHEQSGRAIGAFLRCDRGDEPTDHHTLFLLEGATPGFAHAAFEVEGLDDLMRGHAFLREAGRTHAWGIGRHTLGSAIADYWRDPWGHGMEHWTDGDLLVAEDGSRIASLAELECSQWGPFPA